MYIVTVNTSSSYNIFLSICKQPRQQTAVHLVASRQTGTATSILRVLLAAAGRDIRLKADGVSLILTLNTSTRKFSATLK
jgi:hypothetical protein